MVAKGRISQNPIDNTQFVFSVMYQGCINVERFFVLFLTDIFKVLTIIK